MIALIITINKHDTVCFSSDIFTFTCNDMKETYNKLIDTLVKNLNINIDLPLELCEFEYLWFDKQYTKLSAFEYNIFSNNQWTIPWESQYIYEDFLETIHELEIKEAPDFSKVFEESNFEDIDDTKKEYLDDELEKTIKCTQNSNFFENNKNVKTDEFSELEKKFTEIIMNSIASKP